MIFFFLVFFSEELQTKNKKLEDTANRLKGQFFRFVFYFFFVIVFFLQFLKSINQLSNKVHIMWILVGKGSRTNTIYRHIKNQTSD